MILNITVICTDSTCAKCKSKQNNKGLRVTADCRNVTWVSHVAVALLLAEAESCLQVNSEGRCPAWSLSSAPSAEPTSPPTGSRRRVGESFVSSAWHPIRRKLWRLSTPTGWRMRLWRHCSRSRSAPLSLQTTASLFFLLLFVVFFL